MADVEKMASVSERKRLRRASQLRQGRQRIRRLFAWLTGTVLGVILLLFFISRSYIGSYHVSDDQYRQTTAAYFSENTWQRFKPALNVQNLETYLVSNHPEIAAIQTRMPLLSNRLTVDVITRQAEYRWLDERRGAIFALDERGIAFSRIEASELPSLALIQDSSGVEVTLGAPLLGKTSLEAIERALEGVVELGFSVSHVQLDDRPQAFEVHLSDPGVYLLFTTTRGINDQLSDASEFFTSQQGSRPVEYVDLRVPDKIFFQ